MELYIPIENLKVDRQFKLGEVTVFPSNKVQVIIDKLNKITKKTKNTEDQKKKFNTWQERDLKLHLGKWAIVEMVWDSEDEDKLIPKDLTPVYAKIKEVVAVLYLLQKQTAGICTIEHQKFGLKKELSRSLNFLVAIQEDKRSTYSFMREGVMADWTFTSKEIDKFATNQIYCYFNKLLKENTKNEIGKRIISSVLWLYDAVMDFSPANRFVKLAISLEVLFASGKRQKSFRLSRFSTLLSHAYVFKDIKCQCPIIDSHSAREYNQKVKELNLPGICSAYWNIRRWYQIRSNIVHDAERTVDKKELTSFEWWTHKLIITTIEIVASNNITSLDELEVFLESKYRELKN